MDMQIMHHAEQSVRRILTNLSTQLTRFVRRDSSQTTLTLQGPIIDPTAPVVVPSNERQQLKAYQLQKRVVRSNRPHTF